MTTPKKPKKNFLKLPAYPGGKQAFETFIRENLKYPEEALNNRIEGDVFITYEVNDNGKVLDPVLRHGIGYGCDEEALRLIGILTFSGSSNRGVRVRSRFNTRIPFRLPVKQQTVQINYQVAAKKETGPPPKPVEKAGYVWQLPLPPKQ